MPPERATSEERGRAVRLLLALAIVLAAALAYLPSLPGEFIWDDDEHVIFNDTLRDAGGLADIWVPRIEPSYVPNTPQYYPVTFTGLWIEYQLFGLDPLGYHVVNLALHALNALLVWAVFARLRAPGAWLLGALFAVHPMHVETTAWAMELKNLLSAGFYLTAALCWFRYEDARDAGDPSAARRAWGAALGLFVLALLSKSITCTLPAALALAMLYRRRPIAWRPLLPFFAVGIALALNTAVLERNHVGAKGAWFDFSLAERALIAARALLFYPYKLLVPLGFSFNYPRWEIAPGEPLAWWPVALAVAIAVGAFFAYRRGRRGAPLALAFYAGSVLPATGVVTYYPMLFSFVADHFCYLPSLGVLALVSGAVARGVPDPRARAAVAGVLVVGLGALCAREAARYSSAERLYRETIAANPDSWLALAQLAQLLLQRARPGTAAPEESRALASEARDLLERAVALKEDHFMVQANLATAHVILGEGAAGLPHALRAVELRPDYAEGVSVAAVLAFDQGALTQAEELARRALALDPRSFKARLLLADCAARRGAAADARAGYRSAYVDAPTAASREVAGARLALSLDGAPPEEALRTIEELARTLGASQLQLEVVRAGALARLGRTAEAIQVATPLVGEARRRGAEPLARQLEARIAELRQAAEGGR